MKEEKNIIFRDSSDFDLYELVEQRQHRNTLFLIGGDYYMLRGETRPKNAAHSGHFVVCSGVRDGEFILHDPGPDVIFEHRIEKKVVYDAMRYYGGGLTCMLVQYV